MKKTVVFILGFVIGIAFVYAWQWLFNTPSNSDKDVSTDASSDTALEVNTSTSTSVTSDAVVGADTAMVTINDSIVVEDQLAGDAIKINSVNLNASTSGGWVVVHEVKDGKVANALGAVRKDSGSYTDVTVSLLRGTVMGDTYAVVLYEDDGDKQFNLKLDKPIVENNGEYMMSTFVAK